VDPNTGIATPKSATVVRFNRVLPPTQEEIAARAAEIEAMRGQ